MNRYLLAALYVVAGCAVTVPLKAQESGGLLRADRCRPAMAVTLKTVVVCAEECEEEHAGTAPAGYFPFVEAESLHRNFSNRVVNYCKAGSLCRMAHKIRAPGREHV